MPTFAPIFFHCLTFQRGCVFLNTTYLSLRPVSISLRIYECVQFNPQD